jgi:hypothetical protein
MRGISVILALLLYCCPAFGQDTLTLFFRAETDGLGHASIQIEGTVDGKPFYEAFGFRPDGSQVPDGLYGVVLMVFGSPSKITPDFGGELYLAVPVTKAQVKGIETIAEDWGGHGMEQFAPSYSLIGRDCVTFVDAVANYVGLRTPNVGLFPDWYMRLLQLLNPQYRHVGLTPTPSTQKEIDAAQERYDLESRLSGPAASSSVFLEEARNRATAWDRFRTRRNDQIAFDRQSVENRRAEDLKDALTYDRKVAQTQLNYDAVQLAHDQAILALDAGYPAPETEIPSGGAQPTLSMCPEQFVCKADPSSDIRRARPPLKIPQLGLGGGVAISPPAGLVRVELRDGHSWSPNNTVDFGLVGPDQPLLVWFLTIRVSEGGVYGLFVRGNKLKVTWGLPPTIPGFPVPFPPSQDLPKHVRTLEKSKIYYLGIWLDARSSSDDSPQSFFLTYQGRVVSTIMVDYFALKTSTIRVTQRIPGLVSGLGEGWSQAYELCSGPAPLGFTLAGRQFTVGGDERPRECNSWAKCWPTQTDDDDVCFDASIQGHQGNTVGDEQVVHAQALLIVDYKIKSVATLLLTDDANVSDPN